MRVQLRDVVDGDLPVFYDQMNDPESIRMAAFTAPNREDRAVFAEHWTRLRNDPAILQRTVVLAGGEIAGHVGVFGPPEEREVTYWIGRRFWGRGVATAAMRELLAVVPDRPLHASAAADNAGSIRVLEKCGFVATGTGRGFAHGRGEQTDEVLFVLRD